ncbi:YggT family protein [Thermocrinis minervae]|uniref:YggT family protein n=1 Tax=Thermocrinis minervae TaxID=381751 RepID=A0A1M6RYJ0_9AQUI|nr:YggT family protein [Thermocrinis minervae]SHK37575.1 YggT family protein [Thermocrinis minervae]
MRGLFSLLVNLLIILVILHAIGSWIPAVRESKFYESLDRLLSPFLDPIRKLIPPYNGLDFSPAVLLFILYLVKIAFKL